MSAKEVTANIIGRVEELTGKPVLIHQDPNVPLLATMKMGRGDSPGHVISFNPRSSGVADYLTCYQCGFLLRIYDAPVDARFDLGASFRGKRDVEKLVKQQLGRRASSLGPDVLRKLNEQMLGGLIRQLRSIPIGLRVDAWLKSDYPMLADQQRTVVGQQLQDNLKSLGPDVRTMAPPEIFRASVEMNAAFAAFWAKTWGETTHLSPYNSVGHAAGGEQLLKMFDEISSSPAHDKDLVEAWGKLLKIDRWYEIIPFTG